MKRYRVENLKQLKAAVMRLKPEDRLIFSLAPNKTFPELSNLQLSIRATDKGIFLRTFKGFALGATAKLDR
jgi:hypothetical protein